MEKIKPFWTSLDKVNGIQKFESTLKVVSRDCFATQQSKNFPEHIRVVVWLIYESKPLEIDLNKKSFS